MPRFMLIGLCEPLTEHDQAGFDQWFVEEHIEDTTMCPTFVRGQVFELAGPHLTIPTVARYLSVYEVDAPSYEEAERILNEWQADPDAWAGRARHQGTRDRLGGGVPMKILGSGWYERLGSWDGPASTGVEP